MEKIHKTIFIAATPEHVWDTMLGASTYSQWTKVFDPTSRFKGDWSEGSKILFLGAGDDMGMVSRIAANRLHEFISIEHLGIVKDGVEDTTSPEARQWAPAFENYTFTNADGGTLLTIDQDIQAEYREQFDDLWDEALALLKDLAEHS